MYSVAEGKYLKSCALYRALELHSAIIVVPDLRPLWWLLFYSYNTTPRAAVVIVLGDSAGVPPGTPL